MALHRRKFIRQFGALALLGSAAPGQPAPAAPPRRRLFRVAHLTDIHVGPDRPDKKWSPAAGMAAALRRAQTLPDAPELILFGGDCIGDALYTPKDEVLAQWALWDQVLAAELRTPARHCIGNHDIFGWSSKDAPGLEGDPAYGKALPLRHLGLRERYYAFTHGAWHFVVLDSMMSDASTGHGYIARIDEAQLAWLEAELTAVPAGRHVCVLSHIPILSAASFFDGPREKAPDWVVPGAWMHIDARRLKDLFHRTGNVRICLSGHLHLEDDITYLGVRYLCNGAVCGGWWKGNHQEFGPAFAVLDFYDDGSVERRMVACAS